MASIFTAEVSAGFSSQSNISTLLCAAAIILENSRQNTNIFFIYLKLKLNSVKRFMIYWFPTAKIERYYLMRDIDLVNYRTCGVSIY